MVVLNSAEESILKYPLFTNVFLLLLYNVHVRIFNPTSFLENETGDKKGIKLPYKKLHIFGGKFMNFRSK